MVASVAEKGYAATTVGDLLEISGVSRSSFYDLFRDKEDCFLATFDALLELGMAIVQTEMNGEGTLEERARRGDAENVRVGRRAAGGRRPLLQPPLRPRAPWP